MTFSLPFLSTTDSRVCWFVRNRSHESSKSLYTGSVMARRDVLRADGISMWICVAITTALRTCGLGFGWIFNLSCAMSRSMPCKPSVLEKYFDVAMQALYCGTVTALAYVYVPSQLRSTMHHDCVTSLDGYRIVSLTYPRASSYFVSANRPQQIFDVSHSGTFVHCSRMSVLFSAGMSISVGFVSMSLLRMPRCRGYTQP